MIHLEKLDAQIKAVRVPKSVKKTILKMAAEKRRTEQDFLRIILIVLHENYEKGIWHDKERY